MSSDNPRSTARAAGHPIHAALAPVSIACFTGVLVTDIVYWRTASMQWANFSAWLLAIGVVIAAVATIAGFVDLLVEPRARTGRAAWFHVLGSAAVAVIAVVDNFVHSRDAYTSVVPMGLILSLLLVILLLAIGWNGWALYRREAGLEGEDRR